MSALIDALARGTMRLHDGAGHSEAVGKVLDRAALLAEDLVRENVHCAGIGLDNGIDWICADLACMLAGIPSVPLPAFFSAVQTAHVATETGIDALFGSTGSMLSNGVFADFRLHAPGASPDNPSWLIGPRRERRVPAGVARVTFTSGTTGTPKGVCLDLAQQEAVAAALASHTAALGLGRHLSVLPLAVLLENVAGVYAALLSSADVVLPPLADTGLCGSSGFDPDVLLRTLQRHRPDSLILLPQMLKSLVASLTASGQRAEGLDFVAVGGARTAPELILEARALGLPVYEGYGLSEFCSVVAVNLPAADCPGSVGRPLPGRQIRIAAGGEIEIRSTTGIQYLGEPRTAPGWVATGDLGAIDAGGFLHVSGRRKQVLITAFGRNVSPEWVESELLAAPALAQAMVIGDGYPALAALLVPAGGATPLDLAEAVADCNARLPDYARVAAYRVAAPFCLDNGQLTANGRIRRAAIEAANESTIEALNQELETWREGEKHDVLHEARPGN